MLKKLEKYNYYLLVYTVHTHVCIIVYKQDINNIIMKSKSCCSHMDTLEWEVYQENLLTIYLHLL